MGSCIGAKGLKQAAGGKAEVSPATEKWPSRTASTSRIATTKESAEEFQVIELVDEDGAEDKDDKKEEKIDIPEDSWRSLRLPSPKNWPNPEIPLGGLTILGAGGVATGLIYLSAKYKKEEKKGDDKAVDHIEVKCEKGRPEPPREDRPEPFELILLLKPAHVAGTPANTKKLMRGRDDARIESKADADKDWDVHLFRPDDIYDGVRYQNYSPPARSNEVGFYWTYLMTTPELEHGRIRYQTPCYCGTKRWFRINTGKPVEAKTGDTVWKLSNGYLEEYRIIHLGPASAGTQKCAYLIPTHYYPLESLVEYANESAGKLKADESARELKADKKFTPDDLKNVTPAWEAFRNSVKKYMHENEAPLVTTEDRDRPVKNPITDLKAIYSFRNVLMNTTASGQSGSLYFVFAGRDMIEPFAIHTGKNKKLPIEDAGGLPPEAKYFEGKHDIPAIRALPIMNVFEHLGQMLRRSNFFETFELDSKTMVIRFATHADIDRWKGEKPEDQFTKTYTYVNSKWASSSI